MNQLNLTDLELALLLQCIARTEQELHLLPDSFISEFKTSLHDLFHKLKIEE